MPGATDTRQLSEGGAGSPARALEERFAGVMAGLGPFEPAPGLAVAVSGGADSMALAVLAREWAGDRASDGSAGGVAGGGSVLALVVDHGLRAESADEARLTIERLAALGIPARLLTLTDLARGPALAERARWRRYEVLIEACAEAGRLHLLLGHHAADQAETVAMRVLRDSGTHGLAGMAALRATAQVRLLRPLLGTAPDELRHYLSARGIDWVEDPSNRDPRALRSRLRPGLAAGGGVGGIGVARAAAVAGRLRATEEALLVAELAARVSLRPEGFALLSPGPIGVMALRRLLHTIGGEAYAPGAGRIADLAAAPRAATVGGARLLPAGRLGDGFLVVREEAAIGPAVPARDGVVWDGRFRLVAPWRNGERQDATFPADAMVDRLGDDSARFRRDSPLPAAVLRTLPAIRIGGVLGAVPHLGFAAMPVLAGVRLVFEPRTRLGGAPFVALGCDGA